MIPREARARKRVSRSKSLSYLTLDSGIDVTGTKGAAVHVRSICGALASLGHRVVIHCTRVGEEPWAGKSRRIEIVQHPLPGAMAALRKSLRSVYGPELSLPPEVRQCAVNRDALTRFALAWETSRPDAVIERLSLMGVAGFRVTRQMGIPYFLEVNALLSDEAKAHRSLADYFTARRIEDEVLRGADRVFTVSRVLRQAVMARGVSEDRVEILPNGFDADLFTPRRGAVPRRQLGIGKRFCVGMVGSMKTWHGVVLLLEAFRDLAARRPNTALVMVGAGPEANVISAFREAHPNLCIVSTGPVSHSLVPRMISTFDAAVAPYEKSEVFYFSPMKIYEYLAMGKPVVASDQGQIREVITHGRNGLLFPPGNGKALARRLAELYDSRALRIRLGKAARASVRGRTWKANARRLLQALDEVAP